MLIEIIIGHVPQQNNTYTLFQTKIPNPLTYKHHILYSGLTQSKTTSKSNQFFSEQPFPVQKVTQSKGKNIL